MTITFDPVRYKDTTRAQWQDAAGAWHGWGATLEDWLGDATNLMLDTAGITTGSSVLDVAAGAGGQSLAAARRVGPTGRCWPPTSPRRSSATPQPQPPRPDFPTCRPASWTASGSMSMPPRSTPSSPASV